jgi:hypothetical protein
VVEGQQNYLSVPNPGNLQNLSISECNYPGPSPEPSLGCIKLDTEPARDYLSNQKWQIDSAKLGGGLYLAIISSNFSGTFSGSKIPSYLADINGHNGDPESPSDEGSIGLVPAREKLYADNPTGHQGAYWILRPGIGGLWQLSPMVTPALCLSSSPGSSSSWPLGLAQCATNDAPQQLWTLK